MLLELSWWLQMGWMLWWVLRCIVLPLVQAGECSGMWVAEATLWERVRTAA